MLICFVLSCLRARWLKDPIPEAEQLFSMVAEVFIFWAKSHVRMAQCYLFMHLPLQKNASKFSGT